MPLLSIVIPTRERSDPLQHTVRLALEISGVDLEIIVCDNYSEDSTQAFCASITDKKFRHVRSQRRLTMSQNFELALNSARGDLILLLGDDDVIDENALIRSVIKMSTDNIDLVYWYRNFFYWGTYPEQNLAGTFCVPNGSRYFHTTTPALLCMTLTGALPYYYLPSIYNSLVTRSFLDKYKKFLRGTLFPEYVASPDVFSSLIFCHLEPALLFSESSVTISGISKHSNGMSLYFGGNESERFAAELGYKSGSVILPPDYVGKLEPLTNKGVAELSVLTDYCNTINNLLRYVNYNIPPNFAPNNMYLKRLVQSGDVAILEDSYSYFGFNQDNACATDLQIFILLNAIWGIPKPDLFYGKFNNLDSNNYHLFSFLRSR